MGTRTRTPPKQAFRVSCFGDAYHISVLSLSILSSGRMWLTCGLCLRRESQVRKIIFEVPAQGNTCLRLHPLIALGRGGQWLPIRPVQPTVVGTGKFSYLSKFMCSDSHEKTQPCARSYLRGEAWVNNTKIPNLRRQSFSSTVAKRSEVMH